MTKACFLICFLLFSFLPSTNAQSLSSDELIESHFTLYSSSPGSPRYYSQDSIKGIVLKSLDSSGNVNWVSPLVKTFTWVNDWTYYVKTGVPGKVLSNSRQVWCFVVMSRWGLAGVSQDTINFGGGQLGKIELNLSSTPDKASIYLIPNRVWLNDIQNKDWKKNPSILEPYAVDKAPTNTTVFIDEVVYTIVYKLGDQFMIKTHHTTPFVDEPKQYCSAQFQ